MPDSRPTLTRLHAGQTGLHFFDKPAQGLSGGDQGDGTYRNLILFADYSDPDVIRVSDTFYMVTSTFHLNPGITILESKDLVNWSFAGHAIENNVPLPRLAHPARSPAVRPSRAFGRHPRMRIRRAAALGIRFFAHETLAHAIAEHDVENVTHAPSELPTPAHLGACPSHISRHPLFLLRYNKGYRH